MRACLRTARARSECNALAIEKVVIWVFEIHSPGFYMMHVHKNTHTTPQIQTLDPDLV